MKIVDRKPEETPPNIFYGVDVNDKAAVKKELHRRQYRKFVGNIVFLVIFAMLCVFAYDTIRVTFFDKHPLIYIKENVDGGVLYKGFGYSKLYCNDGKSYPYLNKENKCLNKDRTFSQAFYSSFYAYGVNNKIIDEKNIKTMKLSNIRSDGYNSYDGRDYLVDFSYSCMDEKSTCFKKLKKQKDEFNYLLYVSLDANNQVQNIFTFKNSGDYYKELRELYTEKVQQYLVDNGYMVEDQTTMFEISLVSNYGKVKYKGEEYYDSYVIKVNFACESSDSSCIEYKDFEYSKGLDFEAAMLIDDDGNIKLANKAVFGE
ncbi:MAG: hypothetical protein IKQ29_01690 [Bacilli bacterium]|nr:hypothetical protein [Bacilli bacterium]